MLNFHSKKLVLGMGISLVCGGILMTAQAGKEVDRSLAVNAPALLSEYLP